MKLLILFIYSDNELYRKMLEIQRTYVNNFENVTSYFIEMRETQTNPVEIEDDFIFVRGKEGLLRILYKTVESIKYILDQPPTMLRSNISGSLQESSTATSPHYDFILRTNISTIVNIPLVLSKLTTYPKTGIYTSGLVNVLKRLDPASGVKDPNFIGIRFASGTSIILSNDVARNLVENRNKLRRDVIDDVSIALYIAKYLPNVYSNIYNYKLGTAGTSRLLEKKDVNINSYFFRNRIKWNIDERANDIINMKTVCGAYFERDGAQV